MKDTNTIKDIDIDMAVGIIRSDIGYEKGECLMENNAMASFLIAMNIDFTFEIGEAIYIPHNGYFRIAHRDFRDGMKYDEPDGFHCWLEVDGKVMDIAVGSWTRDLPDAYKKEYIYGNYHKGFHLGKTFNRDEICEVYMPNDCHSYRKFSSQQRGLDLALEDSQIYNPEMTMYENLGFRDEYNEIGEWYSYQYRKNIEMIKKASNDHDHHSAPVTLQ